jgi:hypothetical protein
MVGDSEEGLCSVEFGTRVCVPSLGRLGLSLSHREGIGLISGRIWVCSRQSGTGGGFPPRISVVLLVIITSLLHSLRLRIDAARFSETSVPVCEFSQHNVPEDRNLVLFYVRKQSNCVKSQKTSVYSLSFYYR